MEVNSPNEILSKYDDISGCDTLWKKSYKTKTKSKKPPNSTAIFKLLSKAWLNAIVYYVKKSQIVSTVPDFCIKIEKYLDERRYCVLCLNNLIQNMTA